LNHDGSNNGNVGITAFGDKYGETDAFNDDEIGFFDRMLAISHPEGTRWCVGDGCVWYFDCMLANCPRCGAANPLIKQGKFYFYFYSLFLLIFLLIFFIFIYL